MLSSDRRTEIAAFLRVRRTRRQPEEVGLPRGGRRRTPGLRREEVAALAGVSTEWYTWLEQARDVRPSPETLRRIAAALRLEPGESQHLLTLAGYGVTEYGNGASRQGTVSDRLQRLLDQLGICPAWVYGERWDIVAWNEAATVIHGDLAAMQGIERNALYQLYLNPRWRRTLVDWELHARDCVAKLRVAYARNVDDPWFNELVGLLRARSREFAEWWNHHDVQLVQDGVKCYDHPDLGRLSFEFTILDLADERSALLHLVTYVPAPGTDTREKMERLLAGENAEAAGLAATA
jgi:transcriptional regulator with XRE-family HTH domain